MNKKVFIPLIDSFVISDNNRKLYDFMRMWSKMHDLETLDQKLGSILEFKRGDGCEYEISKRLSKLFNTYIGKLYTNSNGILGFDITVTLKSNTMWVDETDKQLGGERL